MGVDKKYGCSSDKSVSVRKPQPSYTLRKYFFQNWSVITKIFGIDLLPPSKAKDGGIMLSLMNVIKVYHISLP